jgi:hypothetical protein
MRISDAFSGQHGISARVLGIDNVNPWTKAGVMIRDAESPGSPHVMVVVTPGKGVAMQYRAAPNGVSSNISVAGAAPKWVRVGRTGSIFGRVDVAMREFPIGGLVITSHDNTRVASASFDDVYKFQP